MPITQFKIIGNVFGNWIFCFNSNNPSLHEKTPSLAHATESIAQRIDEQPGNSGLEERSGEEFILQDRLSIKKATKTLVTSPALARSANILQIDTSQVPFVEGDSFRFRGSTVSCDKYLPCSILVEMKLMPDWSEHELLQNFDSTRIADEKQLEQLEKKYHYDLGSYECLICLSEYLLKVFF